MTRLFTLIVGVLLLAGCSTADTGAPSSAGALTGSSAPTSAPVAEPVAISIPKIGARSDLVPLGLDAEGALEVPPVTDPLQAGYYAGANPDEPGDEVLPGERGSAVVAAHVDGVINGQKGEPGLFYKLHELTPGDEVLVEQADGGQLQFLVERVQRVDKDEFPSESVYLAADMPRLNLVTCGGPFDRSSGHYTENLIVHTVLAPEQQ